jgi:hypothetical protein
VTLTPDTARALRAAVQDDLDPGQRSALFSWLAFTGTFTALRGITWSIRAGKGPFGNLSLGGEHLHHYMWGIAMLAGVGAIAVHGTDEQRRHPAVAVSYGSGLALIIDEFALLLDLKDVYWAKQGRISIDLGIGGIAAAGSYFAALPALRRVRRDRRDRLQRAGRAFWAGRTRRPGRAGRPRRAGRAGRPGRADAGGQAEPAPGVAAG